jgi:hypothetical protein
MNDINNPHMEQAISNVESLIENLTVLEVTGWLGNEDMDEVAYYLTRIINIVGLEIDIDRINDEHINKSAE